MGEKRRRRTVRIALGTAVAVLVGAALYWFQPWKLWQDETVADAFPVTAPATPSDGGTGGDAAAEVRSDAPRLIASGSLISHEHATTGAVKIFRLADGSHTLRLENLDTSNGPDLHVLLSDGPVEQGVGGWRVFDDGAHVSVAALKGNKGDQNYALPTGLALDQYSSVSIWCDRFDVSFGAAALRRA